MLRLQNRSRESSSRPQQMRMIRSILTALVLMLGACPAIAANQASLQVPIGGPLSATQFTTNYLNPALLALATCNWGPSAPVNGPGGIPTFGQCWVDTSQSPVFTEKFYDGVSWVSKFIINGSTHIFTVAPSGNPIVIFAWGQSNFVVNGSFAWTPNPAAKIWNNTVGTVSTGTAYVPLPSTTITLPQKFASNVADATGRPVCLIVSAFSGQPMSHWLTGTGAPDAYADALANVAPALTACGATKINIGLFWQGEANTLPITSTYAADFETMLSRFRGNTWFQQDLPIVIHGIASTAISGNADGDNFNNILQGIVSADADNRRFVYTSTLPGSTYWNVSNPGHMTGQGYFSAGSLSAREYLTGVGRNINPGIVYQPTTGNMVFGKTAYSSVPYLFNNNPNVLGPGNFPSGGSIAQFFQADGQAALVLIDTFGNFGNFICRRRNNTANAPTGVVTDDLLCGLGASAFDGTADTFSKASLSLLAAETWGVGAHGTYATLNLTKPGTDTFRSYRFDSDGVTIPGSTSGGVKIAAPATGTGTVTVPAITDTLVSRTSVDTMSNKTLTAPVINNPTGIVKADVGLGSVPNVDMTNLGNATSGTVAAGRMPAFTGDCTTSAGAIAVNCTKLSGIDQTVALTSYTPTITCGGGTPALNSATGFYLQAGKRVFITMSVSAPAGTCTVNIKASLPLNAITTRDYSFSVFDKNSGAGGSASIVGASDATTIHIFKYDGAYPTGYSPTVTGWYEIP